MANPLYGQQAIRSQYINDPRRQMLDAMVQTGSSTAPVQSWGEGLARALQAGIGGYYGGQLRRENEQRQEDYSNAMQQALAGAQGYQMPMPQGVQGPPQMATGMQGMSQAALASGNKDILPQAMEWQMQGMEQERQAQERDLLRQQGLEDYETKLKLAQQYGSGSSKPSSVAEWEYYNQLPQDQKDQYLLMKRSNPYLNLGGRMVQPSPTQSGTEQGAFDITPKASEMPEFKGEQAKQTAIGKIEGETQAGNIASLPQIEAEVNQTIDILNKLENHPGFSDVIGVPSISGMAARKDPNSWLASGSDASGAMALVNQLGGKQFLQAFESLKGGGQITEIEGKKATDAMSVLQTVGMKEEEYKKAMRDYKEVIMTALDRKRRGIVVNQSVVDGGAQKTRLKYNPATGELE